MNANHAWLANTIDFQKHNDEVKAVWDAFHQRKPTRVPITVGGSIRNLFQNPELNTTGYTFEDFFKNPQAQIECQLAYQKWCRYNLVCDNEMGPPKNGWQVGVDFQNSFEAGWMGCPLHYSGNDVPDTIEILKEDKSRLYQLKEPDALRGGLLGRAMEFFDYMHAKCPQMEFEGLPVKPPVSIPGEGTDGPFDLAYKLRGAEQYAWPDPASISFREFEQVAPLLPPGMLMIGQTGGVLEMAEGLCGYEQLCLLLADDRPLVHDIFERIGILYERMYEGMAQIDKVGALVISDDLGFKTQTLIAPEDLKEFVFPRHRRLAEIIHKHGKPCILHSCGNLRAVMEDLIVDVGIDAKHSYEDVIMPVAEAKQLYGRRIAILGGFDVDRLCRSTESEIRDYVDFLIDRLGQDGGYALGSGNSIADYVPMEHYLTMLEQGWKRR